jgi:NADP-dependent 3-hydroxy acid dehydrogenase YdfG
MAYTQKTAIVTGASQGIGAVKQVTGEVLHVDGGAHVGKW